eukprot:TRINITY_DN4855_c0_g1_i3.p3 TRINITY_DN4855_c0_g1~~TRINITY_DN4855_c0_g1_i3.p3  ORF type:complete len:140 (-),score=45.08 TRINITY_DN4855_c0_g1_i3:909-1328(-)
MPSVVTLAGMHETMVVDVAKGLSAFCGAEHIDVGGESAVEDLELSVPNQSCKNADDDSSSAMGDLEAFFGDDAAIECEDVVAAEPEAEFAADWVAEADMAAEPEAEVAADWVAVADVADASEHGDDDAASVSSSSSSSS